MTPLAEPISEAKRIIDQAKARGVVLRLFGGVSFFFRCPSAKHRSLRRNYVDIDLVGHSRQTRDITRLFVELGYVGRDRFNALQGHKRLIFNDIQNQRRVDIFLDVFQMCHRFDFRDRLEIDEDTIPLADMLATKLQIVEISTKDLKDILSMFADYDVGANDSHMINGAYLSKLCSDDWGIYKTFTMNMGRVTSMLPESGIDVMQVETVNKRIKLLSKMIEDVPKSFKWKMRARVGEKVKWYLLPEADQEVIDSRINTTTSGPAV